MKEQKPKGKSQIPQPEPQPPEVEPSPLRRQDDDVDFEILDALEQIEQGGKGTGDSLPDDEDAIALNLDDEDLVFDDDEIPETEEFHFDDDDDLSASLAEAAQEEPVPEPDQTFGEVDDDLDISGESFDLDDEDIDLQFDTKFDAAAEDDEVLDFGDDASAIMSEDALPEEFLTEETPDTDWEDTEKSLGDVNFEELPEMDESFDFESQSDDDSVISPEESDMPTAQDAAAFPGKAVISVAGDQVIDLGNEHDLEETLPDEFAEFPEDMTSDQETEHAAEMDLAGLEADAQKILSNIVAGQAGEEEAEAPEEEPVEGVKEEEHFMASLEDIDIDLEEDVVGMFDASEEEHEMAIEETAPEMAETTSSVTVPVLDDDLAELHAQSLEAELREEGLAAVDFDLSLQGQPLPMSEEAQLKALGIVPRLTDPEVAKIEHLVTEAKTLQFYAEKLTVHQTEITPRIYQKLAKEYMARKIEIFREPEFISIRMDVEQDLQDMLRKRSDFTTTITRLNEELEEVKVRHLVGEFTDAMLANKQRDQQAEILEWQRKMDVLGALIERYQTLLDTAQELNPLEEETLPEDVEPAVSKEIPPAMEAGEPFGVEESLLEESVMDEFAERIPSAEELADEQSPADVLAELSSLPEEDLEMTAATGDAEVSGVIAEDLDKEMEDLETLTSIFDEEDSSEWETEAEEATALGAEGFDEQEFDLDTGTGEEEDFDIENFTEIEDELSSQLSEEEVEEEAPAPEPTITCKKCGRATPAAEKFCVNCGAKAR
jgi:hypothetical protein